MAELDARTLDTVLIGHPGGDRMPELVRIPFLNPGPSACPVNRPAE